MMPSGCFGFGTILLLLLLTGLDTNNKAAAFAFAYAPSALVSSPTPWSTNTILGATKCHDESSSSSNNSNNNDRRNFLVSVLAIPAVATFPGSAMAAANKPKTKTRYVMDDETGDYVAVEDDGDWQKEWKSRYDQMSTMSKDEIFVAARGAGNIDSKDLINESPASRKRRAFSGCRDKGTRAKLDNIGEKECSKRVMEGDYEFVLPALQ